VERIGRAEPRLWTRPLRPLTPETSRGFEVIDFARDILHVELRPWQKWLLIHALEVLEDGRYRFRRVTVLVARQNGKTMLMSVLAAWWIFVDSHRRPDMVPPFKFKVVGVAQNLDIAAEVWGVVKQWCNPSPETDEEAELVVPALQAATAGVRDANGERGIFSRSRAHYEMRAASGARGKPAARAIMDEVRELKKWDAFNAVSQITKSFWSNQMWLISNAGDATSVVLAKQREVGLALVKSWAEKVDAGVQSPDEWAAEHDATLGHFEWSAPEGCSLDDVEGILAANPSIGSPGCDITVTSCLSDAQSMQEAGYRTEVLCQWVTAQVESFLDVREWRASMVPVHETKIPHGARTVWGVDVSKDRSMTWLAAAVLNEDGVPVVTMRAKRAGMLWLPAFAEELAEASGQREFAVPAKGCPAMEFVPELEKRGLAVHAIEGSQFALATGRFKDRVHSGSLLHIAQPAVDAAVSAAVVKRYAENEGWDRYGSQLDIGGLIAESIALYGLEVLEPPEPERVSAYAGGHGMMFV
jgi:phage terminase large subunit-like protein